MYNKNLHLFFTEQSLKIVQNNAAGRSGRQAAPHRNGVISAVPAVLYLQANGTVTVIFIFP